GRGAAANHRADRVPAVSSGRYREPSRRTRMQRAVMLALAVLAAGCATATVDKQSARATAVAPESTQVDVVRVPYDPSLPYYVVVVEPFPFRADRSPASRAPRTPGPRYGCGPFGSG